LKNFPKTEGFKNLVYLDDDTYDYIIELINNRNSFELYWKMTLSTIMISYSLALK
jgi:hypothetical protein